MSTPAANKRRRVDAANVTLRKPFHSPVIRRPDNNVSGNSITTPSQGQANSPAGAGQHIAQTPSSPSLSAANHALGALRQTPRRPPSPLLKFRSPMQRTAGVKRKAVAAAPRTGTGTGTGDDVANDNGDHPGAALLALVRDHRHITQDGALRAIDHNIELARQARRIEDASEVARPGQPVDQELRELVGKWRAAGRIAAEEVFEVVKERVANSGGTKAWKEMRQRQREFYQGWDRNESMVKKPENAMDDGGLEEEFEGNDDGGGADEAAAAEQQAAQAEEEESEPEFNMAQMLHSLNIDLALLGYNGMEETWID